MVSTDVPASQQPKPTAQPVFAAHNSALFAGSETKEKENKQIHSTITCDECKVYPVVGKRYKSVTNDDFDICETCYNLPKYRNHTFIVIPYYDLKENQTIYAVKIFNPVLNHFKGKLNEPIS